jgi:hypothetical protein
MNSILPASELTDRSGAIAATDTGLTQVSAPVPALAFPFAAAGLDLAPIQPVADVAAYLRTRQPVAHFRDEIPLWLCIPNRPQPVAGEVKALLDAFDLVNNFRRNASVQSACARALPYFSTWNWKLKTFRAKYDLYQATRDWFCLVNRSKAGSAFQDKSDCGLPELFLRFVKQRAGEFGRSDGLKQAIASIHAQWRTGCAPNGKPQPIPGYTADWENRRTSIVPEGWHPSNIRRQLAKRDKLTLATRALLHESTAAATGHLPQIIGTRSAMKFMEVVTFDDLRFDYLIFNPETGQAEELWALIARESSCSMVLGGVLFPATEREDGKVSHLGAKQMKELAGQLLQTYPLPPYPITWRVERGTATLQEGVRAALGELFGHRINVSYTSMLGGTSPLGYREKAKGNSRGKGSHESHNRLFHTQGSFLPGQIGKNYEVRPAELKARIEECQQIAAQRTLLPDHLRGQVKFPMLTLAEARQYFRKFSLDQNFRTDHQLEGFDEVLEWYDPATNSIQPRETIPLVLPPGAKIIQRRERPVERALRLIRSVSGWTPASPAVVIAFLEHSQRLEVVNPKGELQIKINGSVQTFRHGGVPLAPGTKVLTYVRADEPNFLHVTDGRGAVLGTWINRVRVRHNDQEALAEAMRYTHAAKVAAQTEANKLAAPRREELEALRAHNAQLGEFIEVVTPPRADGGQVTTPAGAALSAMAGVAQAGKKRAAAVADQDAETDAALLKAMR